MEWQAGRAIRAAHRGSHPGAQPGKSSQFEGKRRGGHLCSAIRGRPLRQRFPGCGRGIRRPGEGFGGERAPGPCRAKRGRRKAGSGLCPPGLRDPLEGAGLCPPESREPTAGRGGGGCAVCQAGASGSGPPSERGESRVSGKRDTRTWKHGRTYKGTRLGASEGPTSRARTQSQDGAASQT